MVYSVKTKAKILVKFLKKRYSKRLVSAARKTPFQVLIACILSQRTREENTNKAAAQLFKKAKTPKQILKLKNSELQKLIKPAGFYRQKTKTIKKLCKVLLEKYKGKVPDKREELIKLPGVGDKTAAVVLVHGFGQPTIPVDVHVEVVSKRLGLVPQSAKPKQVREILEKLIPQADQHIVNLGLVHFGREICRTRNPRCAICPLKKICSFYRTKIKKKLAK